MKVTGNSVWNTRKKERPSMSDATGIFLLALLQRITSNYSN
jgi:hypothetical protein